MKVTTRPKTSIKKTMTSSHVKQSFKTLNGASINKQVSLSPVIYKYKYIFKLNRR